MALQQPETTASKHRAPPNDTGNALISGQITKGATPVFFILWLERQGPKVRPSTGAGSGQTLIGRMTRACVHGAAEIHLAEAGFSCSLTAPAANFLTTSNLSQA
jgi:two-component sensor histidine kinase